MKTYASLLVAILACLAHGIREGMVMIKAGDMMFIGAEHGVRGHIGAGEYHAITLAVYIMIAAWSILIYHNHRRFSGTLLQICGMLIVAWCFSEFGYNIARNGGAIGYINGIAYEHVNIADAIDFVLTGWQVYALHVGRVLIGTTLIIKGAKYGFG